MIPKVTLSSITVGAHVYQKFQYRLCLHKSILSTESEFTIEIILHGSVLNESKFVDKNTSLSRTLPPEREHKNHHNNNNKKKCLLCLPLKQQRYRPVESICTLALYPNLSSKYLALCVQNVVFDLSAKFWFFFSRRETRIESKPYYASEILFQRFVANTENRCRRMTRAYPQNLRMHKRTQKSCV
jgi:hypothetical protein